MPPTTEAEPIARFLAKESDHVTPEQFAAFLAKPGPQDYDADAGEHNYWASSRILDQYVVAGLWRMFGIRWSAVFLFGVAMSTLSCLCVFLIARRIGANYWIGLIAAALYFASPLAGFLETWSLRDASPLWFASAAFCFLLCVVDREHSPRRRLASCATLGILAMIGIGWRPDVLLLVLYFGFGLLALSWARRLPWKLLIGGLACYGIGAFVCHAAIFSLSSEHQLDAQNGFQNGVYADFSRANLLEIENSFQIQRCDRATLFLARHYHQSHHPDSPPLAYKGRGFSQACRAMFLEELRYNAFRFVQKFPVVYWQALNGLMVPGAFETKNVAELRHGRLPWMAPLHRAVFDPVSTALPWLFLIGFAAAMTFDRTAFGRARPQVLLLAGLTILQSAALLLVLPEQKHCGVLLLPMTVLGAVGVWSLAMLLHPANWKNLLATSAARTGRVWLVGAGAATAIWAVALGVSYKVSVNERHGLIDAIQAAAQSSVPAPDALRGDKVFSIHQLPDSAQNAAGYLLQISAGANPGELLCRHVHFPQDWCWPRGLETTHRLWPNRRQYFFVTCDQGGRYGDPRPYSCSVFLDGDARIESCRRVDLSHWDRLPVSTLFYDGQSSPGSPRSVADSSVMRWPNWPAQRWRSDDWRVEQANAHDSLFVGPQPLAAPSRPLEHLAARSTADGTWRIAFSDGRKFQTAALTYWAPKTGSFMVSGDFNGDGMADLFGRSSDGSWWLGRANGNSIGFLPCPIQIPDCTVDYVGAGDFNGDGIDDLAIRFSNGQWWIGLSDGRHIAFRKWMVSSAAIPTENIRIGDFNGDGRADIAAFDSKSGQWIVSQSEGDKFTSRVWGTLDPAISWRHIVAADFSGQGRADVAAWNPATGEWTFGQSDGARFHCRPAGKWPVDGNWQNVFAGRFSGNSRRGIVGLDKKSRRLAIAVLDSPRDAAAHFTTHLLPSHAAFDGGIYVGCFNGDAHDNCAGWTSSGEIWLGILDGPSTNPSIRFEKWGTWPDAAHLADARVMRFWPDNAGKPSAVAKASRPAVLQN